MPALPVMFLAQQSAADAPPAAWASWLLLTGIVLVALSLLMAIRRRRQNAAGPSPSELAERGRQVQGVHRDLERLMVEIEQMARRLGAQLDTKAVRLEKLIAQAEEKAQQLQKVQAAPLALLGPAPPGPEDDPLAKSVCALADQGLDSQQIAQRLGEHVGKVDLILALRSVR